MNMLTHWWIWGGSRRAAIRNGNHWCPEIEEDLILTVRYNVRLLLEMLRQVKLAEHHTTARC